MGIKSYICVAVLLLNCYTQVDVKTNVCWALCKQEGADTGLYDEKKDACVCGYVKNFRDYTKSVIKIQNSWRVTNEEM